MKQINTSLTNAPYVYQVTERMSQLNIVYNKSVVEASLLMRLNGLTSKEIVLARHLDNILLSYDNDTLKDAFSLIGYAQILQKAV